MRKKWNAGDNVAIRFDQAIRAVPAVNGEIALQYGPLLYVLPVRGTTKTVKTYNRPGFEDYLMSADKDVDTEAGPAGIATSRRFWLHAATSQGPQARESRPAVG